MKKKKLVERLLIIFITLLLLLLGYQIIKSCIKTKNNIEKSNVNEFYNIDYLFNNNYIIKATTIDKIKLNSKKIYMYLDNENILYIKSADATSNLNIKVEGLPDENSTVYYNELKEDNYELIAKTSSNDIYYSNVKIDKNATYHFVKIGENIKEIYLPSYDKKGIYINENKNITTNFIIYEINKKISYINKEIDVYTLNNLENKKPYYDYICTSLINENCDRQIYYKTFKNEIKYNEKVLKTKKNKTIYVKQMYSVIKLEKENKNKEKETIDNYNYTYKTYFIDEKNNIYTKELTKKQIKEDLDTEEKLEKNKEFKNFKYNKEENKFEIMHANGTLEEIKNDEKTIIITSTMQDKENLE